MVIDRQNNNRLEIKRINNLERVDAFIYILILQYRTRGSSEERKNKSAITKESVNNN